MELSGYLAILRRWWWTLLVAIWVASLLGYLIGSRIEPTYESTVRLLVGPINTDTNTLRASGQLVQTYAELAVSEPLLQSAAAELGLPQDAAEDLASTVRTTANDQTRILTIRVEGQSAPATTQAANAIAGELIDLTSAGTSLPEGQLQVIEFAKVPQTPIAPQISLIILMSAAAGLLGAVILILLAEYLADRIQDASELERVAGERELAVVPRGIPAPLANRRPSDPKVPVHAFGPLVAALAFSEEPADAEDVAIVTADDHEDGTHVAMGFAAAMAMWRPVILIDANPGGLATALMGGATDESTGSPRDALLETKVEGLRILPVSALGSLPDLSPEAARALIDELRAPGEVIVVDAGNLTAGAGAMVWSGVVGSALVVVRRGSTRRTDLRDALDRLERVQARRLGCVLVDRRADRGASKRAGAAAGGHAGTRAATPTSSAASSVEPLGTSGSVLPATAPAVSDSRVRTVRTSRARPARSDEG